MTPANPSDDHTKKLAEQIDPKAVEVLQKFASSDDSMGLDELKSLVENMPYVDYGEPDTEQLFKDIKGWHTAQTNTTIDKIIEIIGKDESDFLNSQNVVGSSRYGRNQLRAQIRKDINQLRKEL